MADIFPDYLDFSPPGIAPVVMHGKVKLALMERLKAFLAPFLQDNPEIALSVTIDHDARGLQRIILDLHGELPMICQRCLKPFQWPFTKISVLSPIAHERDDLPSEYEPLLTGSSPVRFHDMIEDELILCVPLISKHDGPSCNSDLVKLAQRPVPGDEHPLASLATLLTIGENNGST
jgi:uncharacterized protein